MLVWHCYPNKVTATCGFKLTTGTGMLFSNLRPARQAKESKSYVKLTSELTPSNERNVTTSSAEGSSGAKEHLHTTVLLDGLYEPLPATMEIRTSTTSGRGIWTKEMQKAGAFSFLPDSQSNESFAQVLFFCL